MVAGWLGGKGSPTEGQPGLRALQEERAVVVVMEAAGREAVVSSATDCPASFLSRPARLSEGSKMAASATTAVAGVSAMSQGQGSGESGSFQEWSSDSDGEEEPARVFHRRISTNKDIKTSVGGLEVH